MSETLTPRQQAFVEHYAASGNATEAARLAGYKQPHPQGAENLLKPTIQAALAALTAGASSARIATATERQEFWTGVMRGKDKYAPDDAQQPIEMKDRLKASELLGKAHQDFVDRVDAKLSGALSVRWMSSDEAAQAIHDELGDDNA